MNESTTMSTFATIQQGVAHADGILTLSEDLVRFTANNTQLGLGPIEFSRDSIQSITRCFAKGGGFIPVGRDSIEIRLKNDKKYQFILAEPHSWIDELS
ncbi:hypothetical protein ACSLBF_08410 [Pseudoalteromonas sp. T1lg65]|uniref:hypothetical protein n=1 Tax=Pseudoalteromonas sp. T1lg65 TaxID=2077101 RepID=UPI003F790D15